MGWICSPEAEAPEWDSFKVSEQILGAMKGPIPFDWVKKSHYRLLAMRNALREYWIGYETIIDWILAALIARENLLLLGPPGTAKTEIATRIFEMLGLSKPTVDDEVLGKGFTDIVTELKEKTKTAETKRDNLIIETLDRKIKGIQNLRTIWKIRREMERERQKYFHYLLGKFTQPEELFGPIEISLLREGIFVRVDFGLLTGPGVRAAFLDEIFKAGTSILNTLLTLINERQYFNWGGMESTDLMFLIAASNEMPGGFLSGKTLIGTRSEDFHLLYAFLDRFPIRLEVPLASGTSYQKPQESDLSKAFKMASEREGKRFVSGKGFEESIPHMPCINDILLLGRSCFQHEGGYHKEGLFDNNKIERFKEAFIKTGEALQQDNTNPFAGKIRWSISPRKLKALYKIALAYALISDDGVQQGNKITKGIGVSALEVYKHIWDSPTARGDLDQQTSANIKEFFG